MWALHGRGRKRRKPRGTSGERSGQLWLWTPVEPGKWAAQGHQVLGEAEYGGQEGVCVGDRVDSKARLKSQKGALSMSVM